MRIEAVALRKGGESVVPGSAFAVTNISCAVGLCLGLAITHHFSQHHYVLATNHIDALWHVCEAVAHKGSLHCILEDEVGCDRGQRRNKGLGKGGAKFEGTHTIVSCADSWRYVF